ncbi:response regulator [Frankia sp. R82]|uniref:response regulator n=1 Tax=Frankia sp. R82 TaxID=2950553 RepID=UPI0020432B1F|nr:response regulator [Frankia sp. R82]MCM3884039.1 response regulator [Frankia sp. R82]
MNGPSTGTPADGGDDTGGRPARVARAARVLVVDDNDMLRSLLSRILHAAGFEVSEAGSVAQALRLDPAGYDAIIIDVRLQGRPGTDLVDELRRGDPAVVRRCLLLTGAPGLDELPSDIPVVGKPFTAEQIVAEIRRLLPAAAADPAGTPERG